MISKAIIQGIGGKEALNELLSLLCKKKMKEKSGDWNVKKCDVHCARISH